MDTIHIAGLTLECILGVHPHERERAQPIELDLSLALDLSRAARSGHLEDTCDYDVVASEVAGLMVFRRYRLMETATEELAAMLFGAHDLVERTTLKLAKPRALTGRASRAEVTVERTRPTAPWQRLDGSGATRVEVLLETAAAGLYRITIPPRAGLEPIGPRWRTHAWVARGDLAEAQPPTDGPLRLVSLEAPQTNTSPDEVVVMVATVPRWRA